MSEVSALEASGVNLSRNATSQPRGNTTLGNNQELLDLWDTFLSTCYGSGIYLSVISVLTTLANGILLIALVRDPLRHRSRHPLTIFITGLAAADFLTGISVDPLFAYFYFIVSQDQISTRKYNVLLQIGTILSGISMNVSFLVILFMSWAQLIAILFPHRQRQFVTRARAVYCVIAIWIYACVFSFLNLIGVPKDVFHKLDVYVHLTAVQIMVVLTYICLYVAYKRHLNRLIPFLDTNKNTSNSPTEDRVLEQHRRTQKQLVLVNLSLTACLLFFVLPVTITWYVTLYWKASTPADEVKASIMNVIIDTTLYMKFLIDPFIYGLRLPKFRRAVIAVFTRRRASSVLSFAMLSKMPNPVNYVEKT